MDQTPSAHFEAPVFLPDGATAEWAQFYWYDNQTPANAQAQVYRTDLAGSWDPADAMVDLASSGAAGYGVDSTGITRHQTIDNGSGAYWVTYDLPYSFLYSFIDGRGLVIRFHPGTPSGLERFSIPAAAFTGNAASRDYENRGWFLKNFDANGSYMAPVYLPHGKNIHQMRFYYQRTGSPAAEATALLRGWAVGTATVSDLVTISSSGTGWTHNDSPLVNDLIDNQGVVYWLEWRLPDYDANLILPSGVVIEVADSINYTYLPVLLK